MSTQPPKHEMQYFPNMINALPSESGEFRRVLWTGLYSQVVLMTVPVGGDIGDEVGPMLKSSRYPASVRPQANPAYCRSTPLIRP